MIKLAALAYAPVAAVTFGVLVMLVLAVPGVFHDFVAAAWLYYGAALLSLLIDVPAAMLVAHRMLTRRERRLLDAHAGTGP